MQQLLRTGLVIALTVVFVIAFWDDARAAPGWPRSPPIPGPIARPVTGPVLTGFDPPEHDWLPGHRGIDLAGEPGGWVRSAAAGRVSFAGEVGGQPVVTVQHANGVRTTYQPVVAVVAVGEQVSAGESIGTLAGGHCDDAPACLHFGLRRGEEYLDPMLLLGTAGQGSADIRLLPRAAEASVAQRAAERATDGGHGAAPGGVGPGAPVSPAVGSRRPADGPITSAFGMRVHPVTGVYKLHDGLDIGAACGSPIRTALPGAVTGRTFHTAYGWWLIVDHGVIDGRRVQTGYAHAQGWFVQQGEQVVAGQQVGTVGSTGYSTGCHLHFMQWVDGAVVNPAGLLG